MLIYFLFVLILYCLTKVFFFLTMYIKSSWNGYFYFLNYCTIGINLRFTSSMNHASVLSWLLPYLYHKVHLSIKPCAQRTLEEWVYNSVNKDKQEQCKYLILKKYIRSFHIFVFISFDTFHTFTTKSLFPF